MDKEQKAALVDEIADRLGEAEAIFAVDYRGHQRPPGRRASRPAARGRRDLPGGQEPAREARRRAAPAPSELDELLEGPTALTFVKGDAVTAAKAISTFGREHEVLEYKGGIMDGAPLDPDEFQAIARLPGLDVLHGQLVGVAASPLTGLVAGPRSMVSGLAVALGQIAEQGLVSGEAPAPRRRRPPRSPLPTRSPPRSRKPRRRAGRRRPRRPPPAEEEPAAEARRAGRAAEADAEDAEQDVNQTPAEAEPPKTRLRRRCSR